MGHAGGDGLIRSDLRSRIFANLLGLSTEARPCDSVSLLVLYFMQTAINRIPVGNLIHTMSFKRKILEQLYIKDIRNSL